MRMFTLAAVALAAVSIVPSTFGGQPSAQTLTPPPPSFETCKAVGTGTICSGSRVEPPYGPVGTGIICGSGATAFEIFDSGTDIQHHAMRIYDADGNLTRRVFTDDYVSAQFSNLLIGATVRYTQHNVTTGILAVPGDLSTETQTLRGENNYTVPGLGVVFLNAGRTVFAPDGSEEFSAGPHSFDAYFSGDSSAIASLCTALGG
jgi:hypothetical protein